jgi:hypothetical protein
LRRSLGETNFRSLCLSPSSRPRRLMIPIYPSMGVVQSLEHTHTPLPTLLAFRSAVRHHAEPHQEGRKKAEHFGSLLLVLVAVCIPSPPHFPSRPRPRIYTSSRAWSWKRARLMPGQCPHRLLRGSSAPFFSTRNTYTVYVGPGGPALALIAVVPAWPVCDNSLQT